MKRLPVLCFCLLTGYFLSAQNERNAAAYNPHELFAEEFHPPAGNAFRSAKGVPGPLYWQNQADYSIRATLSDNDPSLSGEVTITYTNNSPDPLDYLWLQLDQNIFSPASRSAAASPAGEDAFGVLGNKNGGYRINNLSVTQAGNTYRPVSVVSDTRMQLRLERPMLPKGDVVVITMNFDFIIPATGAGRFGWINTKSGKIYQIAQWYPRMCVYDDVEGWNTLPYLGQGEFYCDYGNYEYSITAPADMVIFGSGDLQNAGEVLSEEVLKRLAQAAKSDETTTIIGVGESEKLALHPEGKNTLTWRFSMKNTRDVAFAAGKNMIWDAAKVNLPSGRNALAMSVYPRESMGRDAWSRATEYLKNAMEIYSKDYFEYPWNTAVSVGGTVGGMEYPGMIFNDYKETNARLWFLVSHEIGHNWFPMIVGNNERKYMWQDEGLNTYINYRANEDFNRGEYITDPSYLKKDFFASLDYTEFMQYRDPLMAVSDAMDIGQHYQYYGKTAYGLLVLRNVVVGKERFDYAFRKYTEAWAFKHPTPYDFFHCINNAAGEDLNWFWKQWFFTTWKFDQAVGAVKYVQNDASKGALITLENRQKMIFPAIVKVVESNGKSSIVQLPVEIWQRGGTWTFQYPSTSAIQQVILDPEHLLPDTERKNNVWER